jgi:hypothetical protein
VRGGLKLNRTLVSFRHCLASLGKFVFEFCPRGGGVWGGIRAGFVYRKKFGGDWKKTKKVIKLQCT